MTLLTIEEIPWVIVVETIVVTALVLRFLWPLINKLISAQVKPIVFESLKGSKEFTDFNMRLRELEMTLNGKLKDQTHQNELEQMARKNLKEDVVRIERKMDDGMTQINTKIDALIQRELDRK